MDYFTGDGTSTTFQLSRIPASATSILVHIGGVKQVASTTDPAYYLDGSKLVFVSPPGAYSPIEVNYLGIAGQVNIPGVQSITQDMLSLQLANTFVYQTTANGATASFTLNAPPVSANSLVVSANGVVQYDYSVNGTNLTFGFTPPVGTLIRITSLALAQAGVPSDGSVTTIKLGSNLSLSGNTSTENLSYTGTLTGSTGILNIGSGQIYKDASGNVGINNAAPVSKLYIGQTSTDPSLSSIAGAAIGLNFSSSVQLSVGNYSASPYASWIQSGRTSSSSTFPLALNPLGSPVLINTGNNTAGNGYKLQISDGTITVGYGYFSGGVSYEGTYSNHPLGFLTNNTERMRIDTSGNLLVGTTDSSDDANGIRLKNDNYISVARSGNVCLVVGRNTNDGAIVSIRQAGTEEGTISVSGTTVSYNGGHLSRWAQTTTGKDDSLLKGTVLSNLDDMCVWTKDGTVLDNEQLNKMKVSDVEGDTNVAGVFVNWTRDEDCNSDDMNIAMTGDMIIRIAEGVVVQKGDLLMSAGDGTAKPQGDDIVRSKTIAKVTSNYVTCTYADGSYCVPCVLMAC